MGMKKFHLVREDHLRLAIEALRDKAHDEAGHSQAPDFINKEDTAEWSAAEKLAQSQPWDAAVRSSYIQDVFDFHQQFRLMPEAKQPLTRHMARRRADQMREELREFEDGCADNDVVKAVDAVADLIYFACGAAIMMGVSPTAFSKCWAAVHRSNMAKQMIPELSGSLKQGIVKPEGWVPPTPWIIDALRADGFALPQDVYALPGGDNLDAYTGSA